MKTRKSGFVCSILSLLMLLTPSVAAQSSGTVVPGAITVSGEGTASVSADEALVVISLGTDGSAYFDPTTGMPIEGIETIEIDPTSVIDAMVAYGVPVNDIEVAEPPFTGEWGTNSMPLPVMVIATIPNPTTDELTGLLEVVRQAATSEGLFINQFGVMYSIADCRPLRQQARVAAVANARLEAEDQATALNTAVGDVVASRDVMPIMMGAFQANNCNNVAPMKPFFSMYSATPFDPTVPAEVSVTIAVEVSFDIP